mgnify:CR=1 FL=1
MTWVDVLKNNLKDVPFSQMISTTELAAMNDPRYREVKRTGVCRKCGKSKVIGNKCEYNLPPPSSGKNPNCPMKGDETSRPRGFPTRFD